MKIRNLIYNARIYTQADNLVVNSIALYDNKIVALGNNLEYDPDFKSYSKFNLKGRTVIPGLVDAHTHFYYLAMTLGHVNLDGVETLESALDKIGRFAKPLGKNDWVVGDGFSPDRLKKRQDIDRYILDKVCGGRPVFIFSKDQHTAWVNSRALALAGIDKNSSALEGGEIVRDGDGIPTGVLRENQAYLPVYRRITRPSKSERDRRYKMALALAYEKGVTGVHSFDGPEAFEYFSALAEKNRLGLRINYYAPADHLPQLVKNKTYYGTGTDFFRLAGVKIFADGSLGSQSAYCFNKYRGSKDNYGIETTTVQEMRLLIKEAARLGLPCAIHAIGDRAIAHVLDVFQAAPKLDFGARHRIEHLQMIRRKDVSRVKNLNIIASMQPSHCPSDIKLVDRYWGKRGANAYIFRTLMDRKIDIAFGSDAPIESLDPVAGIAAAVTRARPKSREVFYPEQRLSAAEALYCFTVGPAVAAGQSHCRGYLLPGYPSDLVVIDRDITRLASTRLYDTKVLATVIDGQVRYCHPSLKLWQ
ncbi:MAG: amidohydrolase [candidate division Zixibacteria bacterium]|nr:amidohydrolase [candidate division Zixibacteria bacterium]MDD5425522.1 amidohydrolase [candidate division Zixibacteria bacterium]